MARIICPSGLEHLSWQVHFRGCPDLFGGLCARDRPEKQPEKGVWSQETMPQRDWDWPRPHRWEDLGSAFDPSCPCAWLPDPFLTVACLRDLELQSPCSLSTSSSLEATQTFIQPVSVSGRGNAETVEWVQLWSHIGLVSNPYSAL